MPVLFMGGAYDVPRPSRYGGLAAGPLVESTAEDRSKPSSEKMPRLMLSMKPLIVSHTAISPELRIGMMEVYVTATRQSTTFFSRIAALPENLAQVAAWCCLATPGSSYSGRKIPLFSALIGVKLWCFRVGSCVRSWRMERLGYTWLAFHVDLFLLNHVAVLSI